LPCLPSSRRAVLRGARTAAQPGKPALGGLVGADHDHGYVIRAALFVGQVHQPLGGLGRIGFGLQGAGDFGLGDHAGEAVRAHQQDVAAEEHVFFGVHFDVGMRAQRAQQHALHFAAFGFGRRKYAAAHLLCYQGMVVGETFFDDASGKRVYYLPTDVTVSRDAKGKITGAKTADDKNLKYAIERMSKSKGNGVDPDEMVEIYGADAARLFVMFAAPIENELVWNEAGIEGAVRFLQRVWRLVRKWEPVLSKGSAVSADNATAGGTNVPRILRRKTHQTIKRVGDDFEDLQFNTPVAALMELSNAIGDIDIDPESADADTRSAVREALTSLVLMLAPFAPHTSEELFSELSGNDDGLLANGARFPEYREELAKADEIEIAVQVNGKLRSRLLASPESSNDDLEKMALADEKVREYTNGSEIVKVIVVPKRLVNIVIKT